MKIMKSIWRLFCSLSGLVVAPVLLAFILALAMGVLPPLDQIRTLMSEVQEANAAADSSKEEAPGSDSAPDDAPYWERRLNGVSSTIAADRADVDQRLVQAKQLEKKLNELRASLVPLLSATIGRPLTADQIVTESAALGDELAALNSEEERFPAVLNTAKTMSPKALAAILTPEAGAADGVDLAKSKKQTTKLLRSLQPRTTGKVLEAMAKIDAGFARELIESMGGAASSGLAEGK